MAISLRSTENIYSIWFSAHLYNAFNLYLVTLVWIFELPFLQYSGIRQICWLYRSGLTGSILHHNHYGTKLPNVVAFPWVVKCKNSHADLCLSKTFVLCFFKKEPLNLPNRAYLQKEHHEECCRHPHSTWDCLRQHWNSVLIALCVLGAKWSPWIYKTCKAINSQFSDTISIEFLLMWGTFIICFHLYWHSIQYLNF